MGADVFVCFTSDGSTQVWDVSNWEPLGTLDGHRGTVYDLTVLETPGQTKLFSASYDKTIRVSSFGPGSLWMVSPAPSSLV
jgi:E3 ubiquitin-protein ligase TRAF7